MSNRSWFFASQGQQQGPFAEAQLRQFIAAGTVTADTLVWSEGMTDWQRAADVPGLLAGSGGLSAMPQSGPPPMTAEGAYGGGALSVDFGIWDFTWRSLVFLLGLIFVIPAPWAIVWYAKWFVSCVHVPGRPNLGFAGSAMTIATWYFGAIVLAIITALSGVQWLNNLMFIAQMVLYWLFLRWVIANLTSNGQPLGFSFSGSFWAYLGYTLLAVISFITIIGWAWVYVAQIRWFYRNIQGTRRQIIFKGTGLQFLWRSIVMALVSFLIIPIPWMYRWMAHWIASQTELVERA